jgi:hypothetical protein
MKRWRRIEITRYRRRVTLDGDTSEEPGIDILLAALDELGTSGPAKRQTPRLPRFFRLSEWLCRKRPRA